MIRKSHNLAAAAVVLIGSSMLAFAQMGPDDTRLIPFAGRLESGAGPADGLHAFHVGLFANAATDASCLAEDPITCGGAPSLIYRAT